MEYKYQKLNKRERKEIMDIIKNVLSEKGGVVFAYVFGSMVRDDDLVKDIDVAVCFKEDVGLFDTFELERLLEDEIGGALPVDLIPIKEAPVDFKHKIISKGNLLVSKDEEFLSDFIEKTSLNYVNSSHFTDKALKEVVNN